VPRSIATSKKIERQLSRTTAMINGINMKYIQRLHINFLSRKNQKEQGFLLRTASRTTSTKE
jgi:hypothetical protein